LKHKHYTSKHIIRVAESRKIKKAKFGHKQFQKGQFLKNEKGPNRDKKRPNFLSKFVKMTRLKVRI